MYVCMCISRNIETCIPKVPVQIVFGLSAICLVRLRMVVVVIVVW